MKYIISVLLLCVGVTVLAATVKPAAKADADQGFKVKKIEISKDMTVYALSDSSRPMSSSIFTDVTNTADIKKSALEKEYPSSVNCFLVQTKDRNILVDAGNYSEKNLLVTNLEKIGVKAKSVNLILLTHCHPDHIGGLIDAKGEPNFPNATVNMSYEEWKYWSALDPKSQPDLTKKFLSAYRGKIRPLNAGEPSSYGVSLAAAYGHTPGHAIFRIGKVRFCGDIVHAADLQFPHPEYCASFDNNKKEAIRARLTFFTQAVADGTTIFGAHIPFPGCGTVIQPDKKKDKFTFVPMATEKNETTNGKK